MDGDPTTWAKYIENFGVSLVLLLVFVFSALRATRWCAEKVLVPGVTALVSYLGENTKAIKGFADSQKEICQVTQEISAVLSEVCEKTDEIHREVVKK